MKISLLIKTDILEAIFSEKYYDRLRRMGELLATTFSAENVTAKIQARYNLLEDEMKAECKRWKWSTASWKRYGQRMLSYSASRPANLIKYLADDFSFIGLDRQFSIFIMLISIAAPAIETRGSILSALGHAPFDILTARFIVRLGDSTEDRDYQFTVFRRCINIIIFEDNVDPQLV